jgi:hypothetical protein
MWGVAGPRQGGGAVFLKLMQRIFGGGLGSLKPLSSECRQMTNQRLLSNQLFLRIKETGGHADIRDLTTLAQKPNRPGDSPGALPLREAICLSNFSSSLLNLRGMTIFNT